MTDPNEDAFKENGMIILEDEEVAEIAITTDIFSSIGLVAVDIGVASAVSTKMSEDPSSPVDAEVSRHIALRLRVVDEEGIIPIFFPLCKKGLDDLIVKFITVRDAMY